jgi:hypothetical protein
MKPTSVVIPAHNEEAVIRRCLHALLDRAEPGELEVIVVCNGCSDSTAEFARSFSSSVRVIELPEASKPLALNVGDELASYFPRFFVDADVELEIEPLRRVAGILAAGRILAAAPRLRIDLSGCSRGVRSWYRLWLASPYLTMHHIGSGVYALSEAGRARFESFPPLIADDLFVHHLFTPDERQTDDAGAFTVHAPRTVRALLHRRVRVRAGTLQLHQNQTISTSPAARGVFGVLLRRPRLITSLPVYLAVGLLAQARAGRKLATGRAGEWERDDTSRGGSQ